jgi:dipeptidyl-peptidase-4
MRKISLLILLMMAAKALSAQESSVLDLKTMWANYVLYPKGVEGIQMLTDGSSYAFFDYDMKKSSSNVMKRSFASGKTTDTFFSSAWIPSLGKTFFVEDYSVSDHGNLVLLQTNSTSIYRHSKEAQYFLCNRKTKSLTNINDGKKVFYATLSPDESRVAFVYQNNLYIQEVSGKINQITTDGAINQIINGKSDWVYEEEFALVRSFEWSPDGKNLAYYKFDESKVKEYQLPYYDSVYPSQYKYKYPVAGEDNSDVQVYIYNIASGKTVKADVGPEKDQYIPRIKWTRDYNTLAIERMNRRQNELDILFADASTGSSRQIYKETSNTYIEIHDDLNFLKDNSFILTSEKEGYNQIYYFNSSGQQIRKVTNDKEDVETVFGIDEKSGTVYYTAFSPTPLEKTLYGISLKNSRKKALPANQHGVNEPRFSSDFSYFILKSSTVAQPPLVTVYSNKGKQLRVLEDNEAVKNLMAKYNLPKKEFIKIPLYDTLKLDAWVMYPPHFDSAKKYPLLLTVYGGPGYQTVKNEWSSMNDVWFAWLASKGYIVMSVNNRGSGGYGTAFKKLTYKKTGLAENTDFINTVRHMGRKPYVDSTRMGIWGWSFGGFMSCMGITRGADVFKTAVAVAPVTDWHFYDNIYTERYMQRPQDNPEGYKETSVFSYVNQMKGNLLLIAGTFDDNVHPANSLDLMTEMIRLGKNYDSEFYPNKNHGIYGGNTRLHLFTRMSDYILTHL